MTFDLDDVIDRGLCVGCGACTVRTSGAIPVTIGRYGVYQASTANATQSQIAEASRVCPFSDRAKDESQLAAERHPHLAEDPKIGRYKEVYAGRITDNERILGSSSGGLTSLVLTRLMEEGDIDGVIHVGRNDGEPLFGYRISRTVDKLVGNRKSFYYATTMADVLDQARRSEGRYAIVGIPCFIKAARLMADNDATLRERLKFFVGILCGHLKSQFFAQSLGWQAGVEPRDLAAVDFRVKNPDRPSNRYDYTATSQDGSVHVQNISNTIDGSWGYGAFQPEACNFCDDVFAETADVVLGDAWLPQYKADWRGTNVIVVRDARISQVLAEASAAGQVELDLLSVEEAAATQGGSFRHRRDGLSVRLADDRSAGLSVPRKRVEPGYPVSSGRVRLIRQRRITSQLSLVAFEKALTTGKFSSYARPMRRAIERYQRVDALTHGLLPYLNRTAKQMVKRLLGKR